VLKHGHKEEFTSSVQGIHANAGHTAYIKQQRKKKKFCSFAHSRTSNGTKTFYMTSIVTFLWSKNYIVFTEKRASL